IAARASEAVTRSAPAADGERMQAMEKRMTALLNTAGKETTDRLARLEALLSQRDAADKVAAPAPTLPGKPESATAETKPAKAPADAFREAMRPRRPSSDR